MTSRTSQYQGSESSRQDNSDMGQRISKLEKRLDSNEQLIKLSEEIVRLKEDELTTDSKIKYQKHFELETRIGKLENRLNGIELKFGEMEERMNQTLEEIKRTQAASMKKPEIMDFMVKKFEAIQNAMEQNERKALNQIEKKAEGIETETESKLQEILGTVEDAEQLVKGLSEKVILNTEGMEKFQEEMIQLMKKLNEQNMKTENIQWMHDEIMSIKKRELQIINMLKEEPEEALPQSDFSSARPQANN